MNFKENFRLQSIELNEKRVIRDAIHDYIHVDHLIIWRLINSKEMQRLRRIKQLGGTYQVFQSAEHSRFVHSLGVYQVVRRMLETECLTNALSDYDKLCVMCAGLLHDIGHGPFSHSFEGVFEENHEDMTVRMILEESEVHDILVSLYKQLPQDVASIIQHTHPNRILIQMVSSQLDADRMDYLLRDSYMSGTTYGHFDMSRILRTMRIRDGKIVYKESGVQAIENYILARYHMYWQVYLHPVARSYETLLSILFRRMKEIYALHPEYLSDVKMFHPFLCGADAGIDALYRLDESAALYGFSELVTCRDEILRDISYRLLNRKLFEYVTLKNPEDLERIQLHVQALGYDPDYYVYQDVVSQKPYSPYKSNESGHNIWVLEESGKVKELSKASDIVRALTRADLKEESKLYFPEEKLHIK